MKFASVILSLKNCKTYDKKEKGEILTLATKENRIKQEMSILI